MSPTTAAANMAAAKIINRVLADYPLARERLAVHRHKRVDVALGLVTVSIRVTPTGTVEAVGESSAVSDVVFRVPLAALPKLLRKDESAYREIAFEGDSEFAHTLSLIARQVDWDIEEDLSRLLGGGATAGIVAHRVVGSAKSVAAFRDEAGRRLTENVAEYLVHERNAFITKDVLEMFARDNERLRDDVARVEARVARLAQSAMKLRIRE